MTTEVQWRRRWKPDLQAKTWIPLHIGNDVYLLKSLFREDCYGLMITDLVTLWHETMDEEAIQKRTKNLNPSVEAPLSKLLDHLRENIEDRQKGVEYSVSFKKISADSDDQKLHLTVKTKLAGLPFVWKFSGHPSDREEMCSHLTVPLLAMMAEMNRRQQELVKLLVAKDKEIADHKAQNSRVSRKHLETAPFDETAFKNAMGTSKEFESEVKRRGQLAFDNGSVQELYQDVLTKKAWINRQPQDDDSLADDESLDVAATTTVASAPTGHSWTNRLPPSIAQKPASPQKSPAKGSPTKPLSSPDISPVKDSELLRRQALERRLAEDGEKKEQKKKKKKIKF